MEKQKTKKWKKIVLIGVLVLFGFYVGISVLAFTNLKRKAHALLLFTP